jgi:hypothetical protein
MGAAGPGWARKCLRSADALVGWSGGAPAARPHRTDGLLNAAVPATSYLAGRRRSERTAEIVRRLPRADRVSHRGFDLDSRDLIDCVEKHRRLSVRPKLRGCSFRSKQSGPVRELSSNAAVAADGHRAAGASSAVDFRVRLPRLKRQNVGGECA